MPNLRKGDEVWAVYAAFGRDPHIRPVKVTASGSKRIRTDAGAFDPDQLVRSKPRALRRFRKLLRAHIERLKAEIERWEAELQATSELIEKVCPACGEEGECLQQCPHAGMPRDVEMEGDLADGSGTQETP